MTIGANSPVDPLDRFTQSLAKMQQRIAELERAASRDISGTAPYSTKYALIEAAWRDWTVANGMATAAPQAIVPGATGNWGASTFDGRVVLDGKRCRASLFIIGGAGLGATAGPMLLNLPVQCRVPAGTQAVMIGYGLYKSGVNAAILHVIPNNANTATMYYEAAHNGGLGAITNAAPFAFAAANYITLSLDYERA